MVDYRNAHLETSLTFKTQINLQMKYLRYCLNKLQEHTCGSCSIEIHYLSINTIIMHSYEPIQPLAQHDRKEEHRILNKTDTGKTITKMH